MSTSHNPGPTQNVGPSAQRFLAVHGASRSIVLPLVCFVVVPALHIF